LVAVALDDERRVADAALDIRPLDSGFVRLT
jgi:hypothetical protein